MASLSQFIDPDLSSDDILHSSGYVAPDGSGGGAGGLSMERRRELLNKPRIVGSYQHSQIGRRSGAQKARTADQQTGRAYDASSDTFSDSAKFSNRQHGGVAGNQIDKSVEKRQHFIEPPSRTHDPYA